MKVLITSPSLDENDNVSGIATMIASIIEITACEFVHFTAGRKGGGKFGLKWLVGQLKLPFAFRAAIARSRPDVIHINTAFEPRAIVRDLVLAKSAGKRPIVLHINGGRFVMQDFKNSTLASIADKLLRAASRVIVLSDVERDSILKRTPKLDVSVLPNAVATKNFPDIDRVWGTKNVIYVGRLEEAKGLSEIVESCRVLAAQGFKFKFSCFGTGPDEAEFIRRMNSVIGHNFHFGGVISGADKVQALNSADIFLLPSRSEGLPLSLLEAMAAGCVPIVSNRGSIPTMIDDGRNGFLVEPGDITQIVGKLKFLLSEGEPGWNQLRQAARQTVTQGYDLAQFSKKLEALYADVCEAFDKRHRRSDR